MKFCLLLIAIAAIQLAMADFDVFYLRNNRKIMEGYQILDPSQNICPDPKNTRLFMDKGDVSGDKVGIRCVGTGCRHFQDNDRVYDPSNIQIMEMHLSNKPVIHWSKYLQDAGICVLLTRLAIYRDNVDGDRWEMYDVHGVPQGKCEPNSADDGWFAHCREWTGYRKMRCYNYYTADFINAHDRGW